MDKEYQMDFDSEYNLKESVLDRSRLEKLNLDQM
jgi:hypothetical protein